MFKLVATSEPRSPEAENRPTTEPSQAEGSKEPRRALLGFRDRSDRKRPEQH